MFSPLKFYNKYIFKTIKSGAVVTYKSKE